MFDWFKKAKHVVSPPPPQPDDGRAFFNGLRGGPDPVPAGEYAMWFQPSDEELVAASAILEPIDRLYQATTGIEEAVLALLLRQLSKVGPGVGRVSLPDDTEVISVFAADNQSFLVSANQEKGIRLHFRRATSVPFRLVVLSGLAAYVETCRPAILEAYRRDGAGHCDGAQWWALSRQVVIELDGTPDAVRSIGKLVF